MSDDYQLRKDIDRLKLMINDDGSDVVTTEKVDEILTDYVNQSEFNDTIESLQDGLVINIEDTVLENSDYPVKSSGIYNAIHSHNHDFQQVLSFSSWNSTYIDSAWAIFYKSGNLVLVRYNIKTKSLGTATANKVISNDNLPSDLIPAYTSQNIVNTASSTTNIQFTINTSGQLVLYPYSANQTVTIAGYLMYLANTDEVEVDSVVLSSSSDNIEVNNALTLSATVTGDDSNPMAGKTVTFYNGESSLGTAPTDSSGIATITYTPLSKGTLSLKAVCDEVESSVVSVTVTDNRATTVSVTTDYSTYTIGDTVNITVSATDSDSEPAVNRSVYYNGSVVGTTNSSGVYTETKTYNTSGSKTLTYTIDGVSSSASITVNKVSTTTTLSSSPSSVTIGGTFVLSGTVSVGSSGLGVKLYKNNVLLDTLTTGSGGAFSTTLTASTVGTDSYYAEYEGDTTYASSTSSSVSVVISKKTPAISVSGGGTITQGTTSYLTGSLSDNGTGISSASLELWELNGATATATTTTLSDGSYSFTIPTSVVGNYTYYVQYDGDSTYNGVVSSDVSVSIVSSVGVGSVTLTGDKSVLSFKHDEECVLTATVYDDSSTPVPLEDMSVDFKIGSNVIGSAVTDSNGEAEYTYHSKGANTITITAECETETDTYNIEDNWVYLTGATDYSPYWNMDNSSSGYFTLTTENNQYKHIKTQSDTSEVGQYIYPVEDIGLKSFEATAKVYWTCGSQSSYNHLFQVRDPSGYNAIQLGTWSSSKILGYLINGTNKRYNPSGRLSQGTWYIFKARYDHTNGTVYSAIIDESSGNIIAQNTGNDTFTTIPYRLFWAMLYSNSTNYLKELKVQSLTTQTDYYNIDVTGDAEILSAYDNDTMTVTVTVTDVDGEPVANQSVELFYQGETQDTGTTNSNGVATFTYTSTGFGNASVYAYVGTNAGKYDFIDAKYYASNSDIPNGTGMNILPYPVQNGNKIHFRFHSLPNHTLIGIGNSSTSDYVLEKNGDTYKYHRNTGGTTGTPSSAHTFTTSEDFIMIKTSKTSPSRTEIFKNNTYVDWWTSGNSANRIRVDKFSNDDFNIEVFVL